MAERLDQPLSERRTLLPRRRDEDVFGRISEGIARFLGTPRFLLYLTLFCLFWIAWNALTIWVYDPPSNGFTALTLVLSLQASYSAPLILLAQNRQTDRDRVAAEQDRQSAERNLADTEFVAREMAALRIALVTACARTTIDIMPIASDFTDLTAAVLTALESVQAPEIRQPITELGMV